jgi:hypothetical protein
LENKENNIKNRYIDLAYIINNIPFLIEVDEKHHSVMMDYFRSIDVYTNSSEKINSLALYHEFNSKDGFMKNIISNLCITLYKAGYSKEAITLHMVKFSDFKIDYAIFGVQLVNKTLNLTLGNINKLPFFSEIHFDVNNLINKLYDLKKLKPFVDFKNWLDVCSSYNLKDLKNVKDKELIIMSAKKNSIELTITGIMTILTNFPTELWPNNKDFIEYLTNLQIKYVETMEQLLREQKHEPIITRFKENTNIIQLIKYDQDEYFNVIEKLDKQLNYHPHLPFLISTINRTKYPEKSEFVNFTLYKNIVKSKYLKKIHETQIGYFGKDKEVEILYDYKVMSAKEVDDLYKELDEINKRKQQFIDFIDE